MSSKLYHNIRVDVKIKTKKSASAQTPIVKLLFLGYKDNIVKENVAKAILPTGESKLGFFYRAFRDTQKVHAMLIPTVLPFSAAVAFTL